MSIPLYSRPYVEFDFTRMAFDTRVSFSRSSTGTYFDAAGVMQTAASNVPRKEHNPATWAVRGLLVEEQRTNLLTYSQDIDNAAWTKLYSGTASAPVVTANAGIAPDGTMTADRVQLTLNGGTTTSDIARVRSLGTVTAGIAYAESIWVKSYDGAAKTVQFRDDGRVPVSTLVAVGATWTMVAASASATSTGSTTPSIWLRGMQGTSDSADLLIWGAQLEAGTFTTSYIPTTSTTVTRSADVATFTIPPRVVRLVTIYDDGTTSQQAVTPGASYTIPTGQKPILRIRGYFA